MNRFTRSFALLALMLVLTCTLPVHAGVIPIRDEATQARAAEAIVGTVVWDDGWSFSRAMRVIHEPRCPEMTARQVCIINAPFTLKDGSEALFGVTDDGRIALRASERLDGAAAQFLDKLMQ